MRHTLMLHNTPAQVCLVHVSIICSHQSAQASPCYQHGWVASMAGNSWIKPSRETRAWPRRAPWPCRLPLLLHQPHVPVTVNTTALCKHYPETLTTAPLLPPACLQCCSPAPTKAHQLLLLLLLLLLSPCAGALLYVPQNRP
jgi:hypothetical protein